MHVEPEAFVELEEGLTRTLMQEWGPQKRAFIRSLREQVKAGGIDAGIAHLAQLTFDVSGAADRMRTYGVGAMLFGASQINPPRESKVFADGEDELVEPASRQLAMMVTMSGANARDKLATTVTRWVDDRRAEAIQKADDESLISAFVRFVLETIGGIGKSIMGMLSSLFVSRLATWGFVVEAINVVTYYEVTEVLDSRSCNVCRAMHGKVFPVEQAATTIRQTLLETDPERLAVLNPWPSQSQDAVARLTLMSLDELYAAGYHLPPYHPRCRGFITLTTQDVTTSYTPLASADSIAEILG